MIMIVSHRLVQMLYKYISTFLTRCRQYSSILCEKHDEWKTQTYILDLCTSFFSTNLFCLYTNSIHLRTRKKRR